MAGACRAYWNRVSRIPLRRFSSGGAILCFHSVTTPRLPAEGTAHVSVDAFTSFVRLARDLGELVPLSELVRRHVQGRRTSGLVAVTFDDAYAALSAELRDVLSRDRVPIAIFVVTGAAADGRRYWWDRIEDLVPRVTPDRWRAFETACGLPDEYRLGQPAAHGPLRPIRQWLLARYAGRWPRRLESALAALEREAGYQTLHRSMTFEELAGLTTLPGVEVGVHTVSHRVMPLLSDQDLHAEIRDSYTALRERFTGVLPILAIPFGLYDARTLHAARSAGMMACFTLAGASLDGACRDAIPRFCLTRSDTRARLGLRLLGVPDLVRRYSGRAPEAYPALPSPTT